MMLVVCITPSARVAFCLPSLFAFRLLGIRGQAGHHLPWKLQPMLQQEVFMRRLCLCACALILCVDSIVSPTVCVWINWVWMKIMMIRRTTMFIVACLVEKKNACTQSMKCDNLFDSCLLCSISPSFLVFDFTLPSQLPQHLCVCVDRCVRWVTKCFVLTVSGPQMTCPVWERFCDFCPVSSFSLHLFNDFDIAMENMHWTVVNQVLPFQLDQLLLFLQTVRVKLSTDRKVVWSMILEQGRNADAVQFLLCFTLLIWTLGSL